MRIGLRITLAAVLVTLSLAGGAAAADTTLLRSSLLVADADRSIAFYGLLGFRVESDTGRQPRQPDGNPFPLNAASTWYRLVILGSANGEGAASGWSISATQRPPRRRDTARAVGRGDLVFVFDVADADALHEAMRRDGADIQNAPRVFVSARKAPDGRPLRGKVFHAWDPDGNLIELLEAPR
jgi:catechol 2,3-dioxygenase-like lactoylglutathione lyase family enzyme